MEPLMPSKVLDKDFLQLPDGDVVESDEEWNRCGKWMLPHPHADLGFVDLAWTALQPFLDDGTLIMLKASTRRVADEIACIICYTRPGKEEAKRAATAIRRVVPFTGIMFYKLNKLTSQGIARRNGDINISIYMQTLCGDFYIKKNNVWILENENAGENVPIASQFFKENYSGKKKLPSAFEKRCFCKIRSNHRCMEIPYWYLFCSYQDEGVYLSEMDRVWLVAEQLFEDGLFLGITLKICNDNQNARIQLHVSKDRDVYSWLPICDRIFKEASFRTVMYFFETISRKYIVTEGHEKCDYRYTSGGELYRVTKYSEEYMFVRGCH